ncbi:hypothetical protein GWI33_016435 [Rhynchophorus ferrugineus]|uniref:Uncharacterized protein n=1 Tax=Rhynchophorus ferrugineus TaxID=354439 RepID=A0A834HYT4_RHYFE|nr:hypothetical protein GWI33_016435 [Rhynchophorus ferrugineus]
MDETPNSSPLKAWRLIFSLNNFSPRPEPTGDATRLNIDKTGPGKRSELVNSRLIFPGKKSELYFGQSLCQNGQKNNVRRRGGFIVITNPSNWDLMYS